MVVGAVVGAIVGAVGDAVLVGARLFLCCDVVLCGGVAPARVQKVRGTYFTKYSNIRPGFLKSP